MPLIAEPFFANGKLTADIIFCTQEEYERYMSGHNHDDINSHRIAAKFFKEYLIKNDCPIEEVIKNQKYAQSALGEDALIQWKHAPTLIIADVKRFLDDCNLSYTDFIDEYAKHLKTL